MRYLLDTNVCVQVIRKRPPALVARLRSFRGDDLGLSSITVAELRYGASKSALARKNHEALDQFLAPFALAAFDEAAASVYGEIRVGLEAAGTPIGPFDTLIAAHALALGVPLVTNNLREFKRVPGLRCESWE